MRNLRIWYYIKQTYEYTKGFILPAKPFFNSQFFSSLIALCAVIAAIIIAVRQNNIIETQNDILSKQLNVQNLTFRAENDPVIYFSVDTKTKSILLTNVGTKVFILGPEISLKQKGAVTNENAHNSARDNTFIIPVPPQLLLPGDSYLISDPIYANLKVLGPLSGDLIYDSTTNLRNYQGLHYKVSFTLNIKMDKGDFKGAYAAYNGITLQDPQ